MQIHSIRPFIGTTNFEVSKLFYNTVGFEEISISPILSVFKMNGIAFYLQDAYVKDWIDNTMVFVEVDNAADFYAYLLSKNITQQFPEAQLKPVHYQPWGAECFLHDPSGILWHFGHFNV
ncbi:glyoxalase [Ferruginibacter yonginensis]|uniref:Glyoxalase n=1 Tax=Ferruginibacter yonginensis TaxID=1310416 RepID=A0ABV8QMV0_9BACT